jgi:2-polyprenyl-6-methoxyphenol hydroxylase-like FAD-dependent oxidoreductase
MAKALVVGGSLAGLFAANLLHRAGWQVTVFERSGEELASRGAGIVTHPELFQALSRCGIAAHDNVGVTVQQRVVLGRDGSVVGELEVPQLLTSWGRMYRLLRSALPEDCYQNGVTIESIESIQGGCSRIKGRRGSQTLDASGDLIVIADGIRSHLREQLAPEDAPVYAGYIAWRGLVEEAQLSASTHAALFGKFGFCLPEGEQMLGYPVAGAGDTTAVGQRRYNFVWYRPADAQSRLPDLLTDVTGRIHQHNIAPHLIRPELVEEMRAAASQVLAPQFAEIVQRCEQPFLQPIYDLATSRLCYARSVLIGDAAFVARPHVGMGVTKAAEDAMTLVDCLTSHNDVQAALDSYQQQRHTAGQDVVQRARRLGAYMQAQIASDAERAMAARYRTPGAVMCETALTAHAADRITRAELAATSPGASIA